MSTIFPKRLPTRPTLLPFSSLPPWYRENPHILTSYRPISHSYQTSLLSLTYLHNESLNIYTHLLPAIFFALALPTLQLSIFPGALWIDRFILTLTPLTALLTLSLSATYHTLMNHSQFVSASCLLLDYAGILALILASFVSGIYVGFYDSASTQRIYFCMIASLILVSCTFVLHSKLQGPMYRAQRTAAFVATALSGFVPVAHACIKYGVHEAFWYRGVMWWLVEGMWYGIGAWFFAKRWPECCVWAKSKGRGRFDVWGSSHQVFHVCVVVGAGCHCWGVRWAWKCAVGDV